MRLRTLLRVVERLDGRGTLRLAQRCLLLRRPQAARLEEAAEAHDWRARVPVRPLAVVPLLGRVGAPVLGVVVGGGVRADAVRHRLDERGLPLLDGDAPRRPRRGVHSEQVVAVDANCGHTKRDPARRDAVRLVLVVGVRGDGIAVVAAEEDGRAAVYGRDIQRRGNVALRRAALTKVGDGAPSLALELHRVGGAVGGRHLLPQVRLDVHEVLLGRADVHRQLPALGCVELVVAALVGSFLDGVAAPEGGAELAVLRPHPVVVAQRGARADRARLLAAVREVKGEPPLPLSLVEDLVKLGDLHHCLLHPPHHRRRYVRKRSALDRHAVVVNEPEARKGWRHRVGVRIQVSELRRVLGPGTDEARELGAASTPPCEASRCGGCAPRAQHG
mmetsp:Transcript_42637/g.137396  ORF Transcript_42637/g.137396 Transcript_42637/m.137396 type:complete len:389 (-) Transcript_42637:19-1185(-)